MTDSPPTVWAISDGAAGNERQALALAKALVDAPRVLRVYVRAPWRWFAPRLVAGARAAFAPVLAPPWPDIAIGCGRHAALATRVLRAWSNGATYTVQILDPRIDPANFDAVIAPRHDSLSGTNVIPTFGALNPVDTDWLAAAKVEFSTLQQLPAPRTAVLVGGPRRGLGLDDAWLDGFVAQLKALLVRDGGSLMIASSRRTPQAWRTRLRGAFESGCVQLWSGAQDGANPYAGYLAWADRIVVTPDSVNMLSEACAVGVPVLSELPAGAHGRIAAFHAALRGEARVHDIGAANIPPLSTPLRETAMVAQAIYERFRVRTK